MMITKMMNTHLSVRRLLLTMTALLIFSVTTATAQNNNEEQVITTTADDDNSTSSNHCDNIVIGDFTFLLVSASDPFDEVSFMGFGSSLPGDFDLYLTDNAWNGETFATTEGVVMLTTPPEGIPAGIVIGVGPAADVYQYGRDWQSVQGVFALSTEGEQVFLYCLNSQDMPRPLAAISYNGP
jgi:hypothetical protein